MHTVSVITNTVCMFYSIITYIFMRTRKNVEYLNYY